MNTLDLFLLCFALLNGVLVIFKTPISLFFLRIQKDQQERLSKDSALSGRVTPDFFSTSQASSIEKTLLFSGAINILGIILLRFALFPALGWA
jgi:hypothetical protein